LFIAPFLIIGWEVYEIIFDVYETWQNRSTDIITGILGFYFVWYSYPNFTTAQQVNVYLFSFVLFMILEIWGYFAYKARTGRLLN